MGLFLLDVDRSQTVNSGTEMLIENVCIMRYDIALLRSKIIAAPGPAEM